MRFITAENLKPGMVLGKPFYGFMGGLMLQRGVSLTPAFIKRIAELQYSGLYIEDEFSDGINIVDIVSDEIKYNITMAIHRMETNVELNGTVHFYDDMYQLSKLINKLLDDIMQVESAVMNIIDIKEFDQYTFQHSVNVCILACLIGISYRMPRDELYKLALAAILHDVGKMFVDKKILNKPGKLTPAEFEVMKEHSLLGCNFLRDKHMFPSAINIAVLQHHERYDGSGYPFGSKKTDIQLFAQIISVADVYDAITSKRPYHDPILPSEAYEYIMGNAGQAFSTELVEVFTKKIAPFPLGVQVQLSDGSIGIVFKNHDDFLMRPLIKLNPTRECPETRFIDLKNDPEALNVTIKKIFS